MSTAKIQVLTRILLTNAMLILAVSSVFSQELTYKTEQDIILGAAQTEVYLPLLENKAVAIVANQTSVIGQTHIVDSLVALGVNVVKVFAPEHGFRGGNDAGEHVADKKDVKTGLPIISLYGKHKKPRPNDLHDIDIVVFDIQDVGARFYTYISTMHYVMEACAENVKDFVVLDRPNPNGFYVDGPVLKKKYKSFVGMHPVPVVHGMTVGEYAQMVNGEGWLAGGVSCALEVVSCIGYDHNDFYKLPISPSPNLGNMAAIYLYPSLCFFEGTVVSVGRGTEAPFQRFGHPDFKDKEFQFIPKPSHGAKHPKLEADTCFGEDLVALGNGDMRNQGMLRLDWLEFGYKHVVDKEKYFLANNFINLLAGTNELKEEIIAGKPLEAIRWSWQEDLTKFKEIRQRYLLYPDFD